MTTRRRYFAEAAAADDAAASAIHYAKAALRGAREATAAARMRDYADAARLLAAAEGQALLAMVDAGKAAEVATAAVPPNPHAVAAAKAAAFEAGLASRAVEAAAADVHGGGGRDDGWRGGWR